MAQRQWLLLLPPALIASTALVFAGVSRWLGPEAGYVLGFAFYWVVWCYGLPLLLLGRKGFADLFRDQVSLFSRQNLLPALALAVVSVVTCVMFFFPALPNATWALLLIAIPVEIVQGTGEEIFWRGLFLRTFPKSRLWGYLYPTALFALWHLSPSLVSPSEAGPWMLMLSACALGLVYGWVSQRTGSIRWAAFSHTLNGILAFGLPISSSLLVLLGGR